MAASKRSSWAVKTAAIALVVVLGFDLAKKKLGGKAGSKGIGK